MREKMNKHFFIPLMLCLVPFIISTVFYNQLPAQVAVHFDNAGNPDNYAPKLFAAFGIPAIMLGIYLYSWFRNATDPKRDYSSETLKLLIRWTIPVVATVMQLALFSYAIGIEINQSLYGSLIIGLLIILAGNYLPKCRQNYTIGIKLPWMLHDENNWNKTHFLAGWLWVVGGFLIIINTFLTIPWLSFTVIILLVIIPFVYSYTLYKRTASH